MSEHKYRPNDPGFEHPKEFSEIKNSSYISPKTKTNKHLSNTQSIQSMVAHQPNPNPSYPHYYPTHLRTHDTLTHALSHMEQVLQVITVSLTNTCALPALVVCWRHGMYSELLIGLLTIVCSTLYHTCETLYMDVWGMNDGKWHRLDNVFIILSIQHMILYMLLNGHAKFIDRKWKMTKKNGKKKKNDDHENEKEKKKENDEKNEKKNENDDRSDHEREKQRVIKSHVRTERSLIQFLQWFGLIHCLLCQEKAPWNEYYTVVPIVTILIMALCRFMYNTCTCRRLVHWLCRRCRRSCKTTDSNILIQMMTASGGGEQKLRLVPSYDWRMILVSLACLACGIAFFVVGLNDENDYVSLDVVNGPLLLLVMAICDWRGTGVNIDAKSRQLISSQDTNRLWRHLERPKPTIKVWRIYHGMWHVFISFSFLFLYYAKKDFSVINSKSSSVSQGKERSEKSSEQGHVKTD